MGSIPLIDRKPRGRLIWIFLALSAIAFLGVFGGMALIFKVSTETEIVNSVEHSSVVLARSISNHLWPTHRGFVKRVPSLNPETLQGRPEIDQITRDLRRLIEGLPVLKVKIYNLDGVTIYSTERRQIGEIKSSNIGFVTAAVSGKPASKYSVRDKFSAFSGEKFDVAVVETYAPVRSPSGDIVAVIELYTDVTTVAGRLESTTQAILFASIGVFLIGFGGFLLLVWRANRVIEEQRQELVDAREDLIEKNRRLAFVNDAQSDFFARVSHDLRTPMNAILGFSQILKSEQFGPLSNQRYQDYADYIFESGETLLGLVEDMLDISQIESGRYPVQIDRLNLVSLLDEVHKALDAEWEARGLRFTISGEPSIPMIMADTRATRHILHNVLSNAIKFSSPEELIEVNLARNAESGGVILSISDQGPGVDEEEAEQMFDPYYQRGSAYEVSKDGEYGLTLSVAKALIEMQGGRMRVDRVDPSATVIELEFPSADDTIVH